MWDTAECTVAAPRTHLADAIEEWPAAPHVALRTLGLLLTGTRLATGECDLRDTAEWAHPRGPGTQLAIAASTGRPGVEQKGQGTRGGFR